MPHDVVVSRWTFICSRTRTTDVSREAVTVPNTNHLSIITTVGNTPQGQPIEDLLTSFVKSVVARGE